MEYIHGPLLPTPFVPKPHTPAIPGPHTPEPAPGPVDEDDDLCPAGDAPDSLFAAEFECEQRRRTSAEIKRLRSRVREIVPGRLREARIMNGLAVEDAARQLSVKPCLLESFESGRRKIPVPTLVAAAGVYAVSIDFLYGVSDECERDPAGMVARQMREGARMLVERMSSAVIASTIRHGNQMSVVFDRAESLAEAAERMQRAVDRVRELNPEWAKALKQEAVRRRAFARRQIEAIRVSVAGMPDGQAIARVIEGASDPVARAA